MDNWLLARRDRLWRLVTRLLGLGQVVANAIGPQCIIGTQISGISDKAKTPKVPLGPLSHR
jgi:hypothetical protein